MLKAKKNLKSFLSLLVALTMVFGCISSVAFAVEPAISIVNVFNQEWHDSAQPVSLTIYSESTELTSGNVSIKVGGKSLVDISCMPSSVRKEGYYTVSGTLPSGVTLGENELKLLVDSEVVATSSIYLASYINTTDNAGKETNKLTFGDSTGIEKWWMKPDGYTLSDGQLIVNKHIVDDGDDLANEGNNTFHMFVNKAGYNQGNLTPDILDIDFTVDIKDNNDKIFLSIYTNSNGESERAQFYAPNGDNWWYTLRIVQNGKIGNMGVSLPMSACKIKLRIDRLAQKYEIFANGEKICSGNVLFNNNVKQTSSIAFRCATKEGLSFDEVRVSTHDKFPKIESAYYNIGAEATQLDNNAISMMTDSFTINLDKPVANVTDSTVTIAKVDGTVISGTTAYVDASGKSITLKLGNNVLVPNEKYEIILSEAITYKNEAYGAKQTVSFSVSQPEFAVNSPVDNESINIGDTLTIIGTAPVATTVTASIGDISDSVVVSDGTYAIVIPTATLSLGEFELSVCDGLNIIRKKINIVGDVVKNYYNFNSFTATNGKYTDSTDGYTYSLTVESRTGYVRVDETGDVLKMKFDPVKSTNNDLNNLYGNCGGYRLLNSGSKIPYTNRIVRTSYDIMFPSSGYGVSMVTLGGRWSLGLISNAKAGQWYTVTVEEDYTTAPEGAIGTLNIYVYKKGEDNPIITKGPSKITSKSSTYDDFYIYPNRSRGAFTQAEKDAGEPVTMCHIDNLHANSYEPIPQITSAKYTAATDENIESLVPVNATAIKLTIGGKGFKPETITADTVKLYVGGKLANASVGYDSETQVITVIPAQGALVEYADAKVVIDSTVKTSATGTAIGRQIEYGFDIADENMHYFKLTNTSGNAEYIIINGGNTVLAGTVYLASYTAVATPELTGIISEAFNLAKGESYTKLKQTNAPVSKAMIWGSDNNPYVASK